jgi:uncharacterized protein YodC (DUF2158 family)
MTGQPTGAEVFATTLPGVPWNGWYCTHHPPGEALANDRTRDACWGCGNLKPIQKERPVMSEFKLGDIVRLKSGGPPMTVDEIDKKGGTAIIACLWFDEGQLEDGEFSPAALVPASQTVSVGVGGSEIVEITAGDGVVGD